MLKKLFSRKKNDINTKPVKVPAQPVAVAEPQTAEQWAQQLSSATGKVQTQLFNKLVAALAENKLSSADILGLLDEPLTAMLTVQIDANTADISVEQWKRMVTDGFTAKIRNAAAQHMTDEADISELVKLTKGKDKAVYRILHDKLETLNAQKKQQQEWHAKKEAVLDSMQKLAESSLEPMYEAKFKGLLEQWRELSVSDAADEQNFNTAKDAAQRKIDAARAQEEQQRAQAESVTMADTNRQQLVAVIISKMRQRLSAQDFSDAAMAEDQHFLSDVQHQWRDIEQHSKASKDEIRAFQKACTAFELGLSQLKNLLDKYGDVDVIESQLNNTEADNERLLHDIDDWMHEVDFVLSDDMPAPIQRLQNALNQYQKSLAEHRQQEIDRIRSIRGQLRRCMSAVEEGSLRRASGLYHGIEEKLEGFDLTHHAGIRKQLEETTAALEKLRDWQSFAVLPKKEALIKRMSALVDQSMDPEYRAQSIRDMQDEWKLLSRGLQNRQQDLWETFHDLAQKAYEPCREYFSEQRNLRDINLDRRKEVVAQLKKYGEIIDWENADIKEIDRVLQLARNDWRRYSPVDRVQNKPIQAEFDRLHKTLFDRLREGQNEFKQNKLQIIEQAKALLDLEDVKDATEQAKGLQRKWKDAGVVARKDEQHLWAEFRAVCDQLFAKREQQINEFKAELDTNKEQAEQLIGSLVSLSASADVLAEQSVFENLKSQFESLGTLPKAHHQKLMKQYKDACYSFESACKTARLAAKDQHWVDLIDWVKQARFSNGDQDALKAQWQGIKVPAPAQELIGCLDSWRQPADELNQAAMHEKTIELEILTGVASPEADSQIRMNLQVQALSEGIGGSTSDADVDRMVVQWLALGPVEAPVYDEFEARMKAARKHWMK